MANFSRLEEILQTGLDGDIYTDEPLSRVEYLMIQLIEQGTGGGGGGGGTTVAGVSSFNGRRNAVTPQSNDYTASMIKLESRETVESAISRLLSTATIDSALSNTSARAVQNKVITSELNNVKARCVPAGGRTGDILAKKNNSDYITEWISSSNLMKKSDYDTNNNGKVDKAETADALQGSTYKAMLKNTTRNTYVITDEEKGKKNGVVPLDSTGKILPQYLPDSIMNGLTNGGVFNAATRVVRLSDAAKSILHVTYDTMTLQNSRDIPEGYPANAELYYITTNAGTFADMSFSEGDWLISLGNKWEQLINGNKVSSVNGQTGAVELTSDEIEEGTRNLYMKASEKAKLRDIEFEATKDVDVIQNAQIVDLPSGNKALRLTNKNGNVTDFEGNGDVDLDDYLKKDGNASTTYVIYSTAGVKTAFTGTELAEDFYEKVVAWLNLIETVAWTGDYQDLTNVPTKTSAFINDGTGATGQPYITRTANNLAYYYKKDQLYTKIEVDNLIAALEGSSYERVDELPTSDINPKVIYYVPVDPADETKGYNRYQRMTNRWVFLGTSDIDMNEYLKKNGAGDKLTVDFTQADTRANIFNGERLEVTLGKLSKWFADFKEIAFSGSYHDLTDVEELALKEDLENYVKKQWNLSDQGKILTIDTQGKVVAKIIPTGVVRPSVGENSVVWNDTIEDPKNEANGKNATAYGDHVIAYGNNKVAHGKYNTIDYSNTYAEQVGGGTSETSREDIRTLDWNGKGYYKNGVSVGNTTSNIVEPTAGNDLTTKTYVDRKIDEEIQQGKLLKSMRVPEAPTVEDADDNVLYLVPDPTSQDGHYFQYKKVLVSQNPDVYEMASMGGTKLTMEGTQVKNLPIASRAMEGAVYQYIGNSAAYTFGGFYACLPTQLYGWMEASTGQMYWTDTLDIKYGDEIGDPVRNGTPILGTQVTDKYQVATYVGPTASYVDLPNRIRSTLGTWYTRDTNGDRLGNWHWVELIATKADLDNKQDKIIDGPDIAYLDDNLGLTHFEAADKTTHQIRGLTVWNYIKSKFTKDTITTVSDTTKLGTVDNSKANAVQETTATALFNYIKGKLTGAISTVLTSNLTASRAVATNTNGKLAVSATTATELGYLSGVTSKVQAQLNGKLSTSWTYVGILGAAKGSSLTIGDDWNELDLVMRVKEGSAVYNLSDIKTKLDFTAGDPTSYSTFVGFYWSTSFSCARRIGLSGTGTSRKLNVNWDAENGWALQGIYVYKR